MISKCVKCFKKLGWCVYGEEPPRWQQHLEHFCTSRIDKFVWCQMFRDNFDFMWDFPPLPKELELEIRSSNISSEIIKIISRHYSTADNCFKFCIELFGSYLKLKYFEIVSPSKNTLSKLLKDYDQFLQLMIDLHVIYFGLEDREILGEEMFYNTTLPGFVIGLLFLNQEVYGTVHKTIKCSNKQTIERIQFNTQKYVNVPLDEYGLREQLQLNSLDANSGRPYLGGIQIIKQLVRVTSPVQQLRLVDGLEKQLKATITQFHSSQKTIQTVKIQNTDMIAILLYIVIQASQPNLYAHFQVIQSFSAKKDRPKDSILNIFNNVFSILEKGSIDKLKQRPCQQSELSMANIEVKSYFDQVSTFDL